jgi:hypothetical protein
LTAEVGTARALTACEVVMVTAAWMPSRRVVGLATKASCTLYAELLLLVGAAAT